MPVDLHLCEIGTVSGVESERWRQAVLEIHTAVVVMVRVIRSKRVIGRSELGHASGHEGGDLQITALANVLQTQQRPVLGHPGQVEAHRERRPVAFFVDPKNIAVHVDAPLLRRRIRKPKCLKRYDELGDPTFGVPSNLNIPHTVPVGIEHTRAGL